MFNEVQTLLLSALALLEEGKKENSCTGKEKRKTSNFSMEKEVFRISKKIKINLLQDTDTPEIRNKFIPR